MWTQTQASRRVQTLWEILRRPGDFHPIHAAALDAVTRPWEPPWFRLKKERPVREDLVFGILLRTRVGVLRGTTE